MSYKLITKATLTIVDKDGKKTEREVEVRSYPAPKRDPQGAITVDGEEVHFKKTSGRGRGADDNRYMYATVKNQSGFWPITEADALALAGGGRVSLKSIEAPAESREPAQTKEQEEKQAAETAKPTLRRVRKEEAAAQAAK